MFDPAGALRDNPALFACYVLFVYFRGVNACRIEREMRSLGFATFHRRNLYPRGGQPGWIGRYRWNDLFTAEAQRRRDMSVPPAVAGGLTLPIETPGTPANSTNDSQEGRFTPALPSTQDSGGKPAFPTETGSVDRSPQPSEIPHSAFRTPHSNADFHTWLKRVSPTMTWDWRHQKVIIDQLEKVTTGECKRLMIFLPPRHGKSELVSVRYTAWRMQKDPSMNVILGSYNQRLADKMSRKIRSVICDSFTAETQRRGGMSVPPAVAGGCSQPIETSGTPANSTDLSQEGRFTSAHPSTQDSGGKPAFPTETASVDPLSPASPSPRLGVSAVENGANPFPFSRPRPKNAVSEWETAAGGSFRAVGSGSGVTGFGANLLVIDDPVKNRAQAESETYRRRVWDWYKDDLYTRLEPDGSIVLIQTRWHEDDLAGRLLRENLDDWTIINLPALSEADSTAETQSRGDMEDERPQIDTDEHRSESSDQNDISVHPCSSVAENSLSSPRLGVSAVNTFEWRTAPDIALCPERFPVEALEEQRRQLGTYSFSALYQQRPTPAGGQIFKREWFKNIIDFAPPGLKWKRGYDLAVSTRTDGDYTASFRVAFDDKSGNLYISGGYRRRIEFPEQRRYIIDRMLNERDTEHGVELALHGQALIQDLRRDPAIRGKSLRGVKVSTDKLTRALTWSPIAEEGKVILVRSTADGTRTSVRSTAETQRRRELLKQDAQDSLDTEISPASPSPRLGVSAVNKNHPDWISDLLDELTAFPNASHDDQIDAISLAVQMTAKPKFRSRGFLIT